MPLFSRAKVTPVLPTETDVSQSQQEPEKAKKEEDLGGGAMHTNPSAVTEDGINIKTSKESEEDLPWYDESSMGLHILIFLFISGHTIKRPPRGGIFPSLSNPVKRMLSRLLAQLLHFLVILMQLAVPIFLLWAFNIKQMKTYDFVDNIYGKSFWVWTSWFGFLSLPLLFVGMQILSSFRKSSELLLWLWFTQDRSLKVKTASSGIAAWTLMSIHWLSCILTFVLTYFILTNDIDPNAEKQDGDFLPPIIDILKDSVAIIYLVQVDDFAYEFLEASHLIPTFVTPKAVAESEGERKDKGVMEKFHQSRSYRVFQMLYWVTCLFIFVSSVLASVLVWDSGCFHQECIDHIADNGDALRYFACRVLSTTKTPLPSCAPSSYWMTIQWSVDMNPCADNFTATYAACVTAFK
eukprot:m.2747 g.2747  ORF g.2747 m.2747 type:complete len:408 (+) comp2581_c0_seq1:118-1341(+)